MVTSALNFLRNNLPMIAIVGALMLATGAGYLTSVALGQTSQTPTKTVTIDVSTGPTGPAGPTGPQGPKGEPGASAVENCPTGSTFGKLVINHPGGQTAILTCIVD